MTGRRVNIERLDLDLRGIPPEVAEAAARLLGPALAEAFAGRPWRHAGTLAQLDAGRMTSPAGATAQALAAQIAQQLASRTAPASGDAP